MITRSNCGKHCINFISTNTSFCELHSLVSHELDVNAMKDNSGEEKFTSEKEKNLPSTKEANETNNDGSSDSIYKKSSQSDSEFEIKSSDNIKIFDSEIGDVDSSAKEDEIKKMKKETPGSYLCSLDSLHKIFVKLRNKKLLNQKLLGFMNKSPFRRFLQVFADGKITKNDFRKSSKTLDHVIHTYNVDNNSFQIGRKSLKVTEKDVSLIFGFLNVGKQILLIPTTGRSSLPKKYHAFLDLHFQGSSSLTKQLIEKRIESLIAERYEEEDLMILVTMLFVISFLYPNNRGYLPWGYIPYLIDLEKMNSVSWPKFVVDTLERNLKKFIDDCRLVVQCFY